MVTEAEENNWDDDRFMPMWRRWGTCSLCEQHYHGVVRCALGWACWKTYVGRPEAAWTRRDAMNRLGNGLHEAKRHEEALSVREADLATRLHLGDPEEQILMTQSNLANTYQLLGRSEEALRLRRDVYSGTLKLRGEEHESTLSAAFNYANTLFVLTRYKEAKSLTRKAMPVARRVLGESYDLTLKIRCTYACALVNEPSATLDDLREAVTTLEEMEGTARRVFGGSHPTTTGIEHCLRKARAARESKAADVITPGNA